LNTRILIVGLGQMGARYLQGIGNLNNKLEIDIVEPNKIAYKKAIKIAELDSKNNIKVTTLSMQELKGHYNLVIVATSSSPRAEIVANLAKLISSDGWILEKVLAQSLEQLKLIESSLKGQMAWVNTPRRVMSFYKDFKHLLNNCKTLSFKVNIQDFALGCNSIHFIDLVSFLSESKVDSVKIEAKSNWYKSKRLGYLEFNGVVSASYQNGSTLSIDNSPNDSISISCAVANREFQIIEDQGVFANGEKLISGRLSLQSELTADIASSILTNETNTFLPTLDESINQHKSFFNALSKNAILSKNLRNIWPIT